MPRFSIYIDFMGRKRKILLISRPLETNFKRLINVCDVGPIVVFANELRKKVKSMYGVERSEADCIEGIIAQK